MPTRFGMQGRSAAGRLPVRVALLMGAIVLIVVAAARLSAHSVPAAFMAAATLSTSAKAAPAEPVERDASVPAASTVRFSPDQGPAAPAF